MNEVTADEKVLRLIERLARRDADDRHLRECPELRLELPVAYDTMCGHGTVEMTSVEVDLRCPHGHHEHYEYDYFDTLAELLRDEQI